MDDISMHPSKVDRNHLSTLTDLPNIGVACAADLVQLGITSPTQLIGVDPYQLFETLYTLSGQRIDPCMLDTFISITRFMAGDAPQPWWAYTAERKQTLQSNAKA
jgi:hypothetical protein